MASSHNPKSSPPITPLKTQTNDAAENNRKERKKDELEQINTKIKNIIVNQGLKQALIKFNSDEDCDEKTTILAETASNCGGVNDFFLNVFCLHDDRFIFSRPMYLKFDDRASDEKKLAEFFLSNNIDEKVFDEKSSPYFYFNLDILNSSSRRTQHSFGIFSLKGPQDESLYIILQADSPFFDICEWLNLLPFPSSKWPENISSRVRNLLINLHNEYGGARYLTIDQLKDFIYVFPQIYSDGDLMVITKNKVNVTTFNNLCKIPIAPSATAVKTNSLPNSEGKGDTPLQVHSVFSNPSLSKDEKVNVKLDKMPDTDRAVFYTSDLYSMIVRILPSKRNEKYDEEVIYKKLGDIFVPEMDSSYVIAKLDDSSTYCFFRTDVPEVNAIFETTWGLGKWYFTVIDVSGNFQKNQLPSDYIASLEVIGPEQLDYKYKEKVEIHYDAEKKELLIAPANKKTDEPSIHISIPDGKKPFIIQKNDAKFRH